MCFPKSFYIQVFPRTCNTKGHNTTNRYALRVCMTPGQQSRFDSDYSYSTCAGLFDWTNYKNIIRRYHAHFISIKYANKLNGRGASKHFKSQFVILNIWTSFIVFV